MLLWAPVDLRPDGRRLVGKAGRAEFRCTTLTSGIRAELGLMCDGGDCWV
jgi:hypothetical protein